MKSALRVCPECGRLTSGTTCAFDGSNTLKHGVVYRRHLARGTVLFGRFVVGAFIEDDGAMAIHEGRDEKLHRPVRIVVIPVPDKAAPDEIARLKTAAASLEKLEHPGIARVLASGLTDKGDLALVGAHVAGRSLTEIMAAGALSTDQTLGLSIQLLGALEAAHQAGFCHHDLAPARVRVAPDGHLVVMDLGLADLLHQPNAQTPKHPSLSRGAPYRAPELLADRAVTRHADIYSAGAIMLEMVSGQPFSDGSLRSEVPPGPLARIIARCLAEKPWNRYDTATEVRQKLEATRYRVELAGVDGKARAAVVDLTTAPPPPPLPDTTPTTDSGLLRVHAAGKTVSPPLPVSEVSSRALGSNLLVRSRRPWWRLLGGSFGLLAAGLAVAVMGETEPTQLGPTASAKAVATAPTDPARVPPAASPVAHLPAITVESAAVAETRAPLAPVVALAPAAPPGEALGVTTSAVTPAMPLAVAAPIATAPTATAKAPASQGPRGRLTQRAILVTEPAGAAVRIGGFWVGRTPMALRWAQGAKSAVEVAMKGYQRAELDITDAQNGKLLRLQLMKEEPAPR